MSSDTPTESASLDSEPLADDLELAAEAQPDIQQYDALHTAHGVTKIADQVVAKLAGIAARQVEGVAALGNAARRALDSITERIQGGQTSVTGGVSVTKGERQAAIEVTVIVEYGYPIVEVSQNLRESIIEAVQHGTGLQVVEVNISVVDVRLPGEEPADSAEPAPRGPRQDLK